MRLSVSVSLSVYLSVCLTPSQFKCLAYWKVFASSTFSVKLLEAFILASVAWLWLLFRGRREGGREVAGVGNTPKWQSELNWRQQSNFSWSFMPHRLPTLPSPSTLTWSNASVVLISRWMWTGCLCCDDVDCSSEQRQKLAKLCSATVIRGKLCWPNSFRQRQVEWKQSKMQQCSVLQEWIIDEYVHIYTHISLSV